MFIRSQIARANKFPIRLSSLASVLRDIETLLLKHDLADWQEKYLRPLLEECYNVATAVGNVVN